MTTKPKLHPDLNLMPGLIAVALFVVMAAAFVGASFPEPAGFPADASIVASLGYAMFNITGDFVSVEGEGLLAAFEIIDVVLVAALVGSVMLARREGGGFVSELITDGGEDRSLTDRLRDAFGGEK